MREAEEPIAKWLKVCLNHVLLVFNGCLVSFIVYPERNLIHQHVSKSLVEVQPVHLVVFFPVNFTLRCCWIFFFFFFSVFHELTCGSDMGEKYLFSLTWNATEAH